MIALLLLAAGASSRMRGADKLLEPVEDMPLLRRQATRAVATGAPVFVAISPDHPARHTALDGLNLTLVPVTRAAEGMGRSIACGVRALPAQCTGVAILPADMPEITTADLRQVLTQARAAPHRIHRATSKTGTPGHPVVFPATLFGALSQLSGDTGAKPVLAGQQIVQIPLPGDHAITDLDTPEAWAAWRSRQP